MLQIHPNKKEISYPILIPSKVVTFIYILCKSQSLSLVLATTKAAIPSGSGSRA